MLSHANIASNIMDVCRASGIQMKDSNLSVLPVHHTYACTCNLTFLYAGGCTAFFEGLKYIVSNLNEAKPTFFVIVPLIAEMIYERHRILSQWLESLGVSRETASEDACRIEHVISEESFAAIKANPKKNAPHLFDK